MSKLFRRQSTVQCFFCQSSVPFPANIRNFKCPSCSCWNRYDHKGEIISDEPAMHEEHLNSRSFAKRASPSKDRLPTMYGSGPFCHSCQTNQMLLINLLSNYLPEPQSPEYETRLEMLPAYRESLHARYPPVCESCLPLVEDEIRRKEHMARVQALGGWLTKGKERQRRVSSEVKREKTANDMLFWWRLRGCLWASSILLSVVGNLSAANGYRYFRHLSFLQPVLPIFVLISLLWVAWDPTFASFQKAQLQSREVRIQGKRAYNVFQISTWIARLLCSTFLSMRWFHLNYTLPMRATESRTFFLALFTIELISIIGSLSTLRIHQPPSIRLVDSSIHPLSDKSRSSTPAPRSSTPVPSRPSANKRPIPVSEDADLLAALSLSSKPIITRPVFGQPSLHGSNAMPINKHGTQLSHKEDEMDWSPTNPNPDSGFMSGIGKRAASAPVMESDNWLRPQKFFAPEKPTGLEGLFESTRLQDEPMVLDPPERTQRRGHRLSNHLRNWGPLYVLGIAGFLGSAHYATLKWSNHT